MKTYAPKIATWYVASILGLLGILGMYAQVGALEAFAPDFITLGFVLLALATMMEKL